MDKETKVSEMLTQEHIKELFEYDAGKLIWKKRPDTHFATKRACKTWNSRFAGTTAGRHRPDGYCVTRVGQRIYKNHRIVFMLYHGYFPKQIDHINGDRADNRIENLRAADNATNQRNKGVRCDSKSGVKNVRWHGRTSKWQVRMSADGVKYSCGYYDTIEEASRAADQFRIKYHKEYANHGR